MLDVRIIFTFFAWLIGSAVIYVALSFLILLSWGLLLPVVILPLVLFVVLLYKLVRHWTDPNFNQRSAKNLGIVISTLPFLLLWGNVILFTFLGD